jgi:hypothetical protein
MKNKFTCSLAFMALSFDFVDASDKPNFSVPLLTERQAF